MSNIKFIQGNCLDKIKELPDDFIDCVISSPPYFGLRDYGMKEQFGLESNYKDYINNTIKVFETFKSKLKDYATIWWNVGDSYHNFRPTNNKEKLYKHPAYPKQSISGNRRDLPTESLKRNQRYNDIKEKDLMMIPNRVAIALQENGWYIRSEIIWHKPNPMPESIKDRPTSCHEKIWLITKNKKYYYDSDAIREPLASSTIKNSNKKIKLKLNKEKKPYKIIDPEFRKEIIETRNLPDHNLIKEYLSEWKNKSKLTIEQIENHFGNQAGHHWFEKNGSYPSKEDWIELKKLLNFDDKFDKEMTTINFKSGLKQNNPLGRNKRNVWTITTKPCREAHFATFPIDLIEPCVLAGCKEGGTILDPFSGAGTTGIAAKKHNRNAILIELNPKYIDIAKKRLQKIFGELI